MLMQLIGTTAIVLFAGVLIYLVIRARRRGGSETGAEEDLSVDLLALPNQGLPSGPTLEVYGTPVRLMVLVIAPVGRGEPPAQSQLPRIAEFLLPGLMSVLNSHQPLFRLWPSQLSASGFTHILNNNLRLPGDRGKGSPWCCVSGRFHAEGRTYLAGLVCVGEVENSLGSVTIEHDGQWLDVLRIRGV